MTSEYFLHGWCALRYVPLHASIRGQQQHVLGLGKTPHSRSLLAYDKPTWGKVTIRNARGLASSAVRVPYSSSRPLIMVTNRVSMPVRVWPSTLELCSSRFCPGFGRLATVCANRSDCARPSNAGCPQSVVKPVDTCFDPRAHQCTAEHLLSVAGEIQPLADQGWGPISRKIIITS
jgi:hypothetical protein